MSQGHFAMALLITSLIMVSGASNLRTNAPHDHVRADHVDKNKHDTHPNPVDYMTTAGEIDTIADNRHDIGIKKGKMLAKLYYDCTVKYKESRKIALDVKRLAGEKKKEKQTEEDEWAAKVHGATEADTEIDHETGQSPKMDWIDSRDTAESQVRFYGEIQSNAVIVNGWTDSGDERTKDMRATLNKEMDDLGRHDKALITLAGNSTETLREAKLLWRQWLDSSKDYNCLPIPPVTHNETICKVGNSKYTIKCGLKCIDGYDDPKDSFNRLRCRKQGKFGKELYGEWEGSAACVGRMCGEPAQIDKSTTVVQMIRFPNVATYNCIEGYSMNNSAWAPKAFEVPCDKTGNFAQDLTHKCIRIRCGPAPKINGTEAIPGEFFFSDSLDYTCKTGHTLDGTAGGLASFSTSCQATGEFSVGQTCKRVRCGPPSDYDDTAMNSEKDDKYYGDKVEYACNPGFSIDRQPTGTKAYALQCTADGNLEWLEGGPQAPIPQCRSVSAGMSPNIPYGNAKPREMFYGELLVVTADAGYSTTGQVATMSQIVLTVTTEGTYDGMVQFQPVICGSAPVVEKAKTTFSSSEDAVFGNILNYDCKDGYSTDLTKSPAAKTFAIQCEAVADFSAIPGIGFCGNIDDCLGHTCGPFGNCVDHLNNYTCACNAGYEQTFDEGANELMCGNIDDCGAEACGVGECIDGNQGYTCNCPTGFEQVGEELERTCQAKICGLPTQVLDAATEPVEDADQKASYSQSILYQCDVGHTLDGFPKGKNHFSITCEANKQFTSAGACKPVTCGAWPTVEHATESPALPKPARKSDNPCGACVHNPGVPTGPGGCVFQSPYSGCVNLAPPRTTQYCWPAGGTFTGPVSSCAPEVKKVQTKFGGVIRYTCEDGHTVDGTPTGDSSFSISCLATAAYSELAKCRPVTCGEPEDIANAFRPSGTLAWGQDVTYTCFDGYTLNSKRDGQTDFKIKCNKDGSLDNTKECLPKVCGSAPKKINAKHATTADEGNVAYPRVTIVTCRDGYTVDGSAGGPNSFTVQCLATGLFDTYNKHECEAVRCGKVPDLDHAKFDHSSPSKGGGHLNYKEKAFYKCNPGYTAGGEPKSPKSFTVECKPNGQFSIPSPDMLCRNVNDCEQHTCGPKGTCIDLVGPAPAYTCSCEAGFEIQTKPNGEKHCGNTDDCKDKDCGVGTCRDMVGDYTCICPEGYSIGQKDGLKTCIPVNCSPDTPSLTHGKQETSVSGPIFFPATLQYKCDKGYSIDGSVVAAAREFQVHCKPTGQLAGMMSCQKITCGTAGVLPFTSLLMPETPRRAVQYDDKVKYKCFNGYTVGGSSDGALQFESTCQDDGTITDPEVCEPVKCGPAPGNLHSRPGVSGDVFFGMSLSYSCNLGYTLDGTAQGGRSFSQRCKKDGTFSKLAASLQYTLVGQGIAGQNGQELWLQDTLPKGSGVEKCHEAVRKDSRCHGDYFTYVARGDKNCGCKKSSDALSIRGDNNGDYYSLRQACEPVSGGPAPDVKNSVMAELGGKPVTRFPPHIYYPQGLEYRCNRGYTANGAVNGPTKITSRVGTDGRLSPALPNACLPITYTIRGRVKNSLNGAALGGASVKIEASCHAELYKHGNYEGWKATYVVGDYPYSRFIGAGALNDDASSIKVSGNGCVAELYQHGDHGGWKTRFEEGDWNIDRFRREGARNDDASSIRVFQISYIGAFLNTGCENQDANVGWWKTQSDSAVFNDMFNYCNLVKRGTASRGQRDHCCGAGRECTPSACVRQSSFPETAPNGLSQETKTVQTSNGFFVITGVRPGSIKLDYVRSGYINTMRVLNINGDINTGGVADISMSPVMQSDQWRAVIKWGAKPRDLDTHLVFGWSSAYYARRSVNMMNMQATLEHDDTSGYGPETMYLAGVGRCYGSNNQCKMKYIIVDYTRSGKMLQESDAEVTLYSGTSVKGTWKIKDCAGSVYNGGNNWKVFEINGKTNKLQWSCSQSSMLQTSDTNVSQVVTPQHNASAVAPFPGRLLLSPKKDLSPEVNTTTATSTDKVRPPTLLQKLKLGMRSPITSHF